MLKLDAYDAPDEFKFLPSFNI